MSLELLDPESQQLYTELKSLVMEHAEKVGLTFDALKRIRDGKLYRAEFKTFEAFCESTGMNVRKAYRMIEGAHFHGTGKPRKLRAPKPVTEVKPEANNPTEPEVPESLKQAFIEAGRGELEEMTDMPAVPEPLFNTVWPGEERLERLWQETGGVDLDGKAWLTPRCARIAAMGKGGDDMPASAATRTAVRVADGSPARLEETPAEAGARKVQAMMEKLSLKPVAATEVTVEKSGYVSAKVMEEMKAVIKELQPKPVIDIRAEQYRTHSPIPPMDRPEEYTLTPPESLNLSAPAQVVLHEGTWSFSDPKLNRAITAAVLKAWAEDRRIMNDATSEEDAAWACYIAQQIVL